MKFGKWLALGLLAGAISAVPVLAADTPRTAQEQAMLEQLRAQFKAQGLPVSPELEEAMVQRLRKARADAISAEVLAKSMPEASPAQRLTMITGSLGQGGAPVAPAAASVPTAAMAVTSMSVAGLRGAIAQRHAQGARTQFEQRADGFVANGRPVIDPAGRIDMFGGDAASGDVTYLVHTGPEQLTVRFTNVHSSLPPITVGTISVEGLTRRFASADGQTMAGNTVIPTGRGVVVARDSAVFSYAYGEPLVTMALPANYRLAPYQRGDVAGTGYVLLRRDISEQEKRDVVKGATSLFKKLTGKEDDHDYALLNVTSGKLALLNVDESGEQVSEGIHCRRQNDFVNKCSDSVSYEALFTREGVRNIGHYYWRIDWLATAQGPVVVALERGLHDLTVTRLDSGQKAVAFTRPIGMVGFNTEPLANGSLKLHASIAFGSDKELADINSLFDSASVPEPARDGDAATAP